MMRVSSTQLKAKLGSFMKALREGREFLVTDRDRPVACLIPYRGDRASGMTQGIECAQPRDPSAEPLGNISIKSIRPRASNTTALLLEDRARR